MAVSTKPDVSSLQDGVTLVGQFVDSKLEPDSTKETPQGPRTYPGKYVLILLVGDRTVRVEYRDQTTCEDIIGAPVDSLVKGERVALHVGVRSAQSFTFYYGKS
jgi:hypothetical protein